MRGHDAQVHDLSELLGQRGDLRKQESLLRRRRRAHGGAVIGHVESEQPRRHHHDVAIADLLERGREMTERVRMAYRDENVPRSHVHRLERDVDRRQQMNGLELLVGRPGLQLPRRDRQDGRQHDERRRARQRAGVALCEHRETRQAHERRHAEESPGRQRVLRVDRRANAAGLRPRAANSESDERTQAEQEHHRHEHGVGAREPRDAPAARDDGDDDGQGRGIGEAGERAKPRVRQPQPAAQQALLREAREDRLRVTQTRLRGVGQDDDARAAQHEHRDAANPGRPRRVGNHPEKGVFHHCA